MPAPNTQSGPEFDPQAVRCVGIIAAPHKPRIAAAARRVVDWFQARGIRALLPADRAAALGLAELGAGLGELVGQVDFLLAMGGDGTFLTASRLAAPHGRPVLGINLGGFGFLAALPRAGMLEALAEVMEGRFRLERRTMLEARVVRDGETTATFHALNDIVVGKGAFSRLFRLHMSISGDPVSNFPVDGIIVATPTGSTGYALSAGGPVVSPQVRALIVAPICSHDLTARALVVPPDDVVELALSDPRGDEVQLTADGQEGLALQAGDRVEVREAPFPALLICPENASFYAKLRGKFGWMGLR